jgi:hypothetical protein
MIACRRSAARIARLGFNAEDGAAATLLSAALETVAFPRAVADSVAVVLGVLARIPVIQLL